MSILSKFRLSLTPARTAQVLSLLGFLVLLIGFTSAVCIWRHQERLEQQASIGRTNEPGNSWSAEPLSADDSRRYAHDVEFYYGKSGLLLEKWTRELEGLTEGKALAKTVAVGSLVVAGGLFLISRRISL